MLSHSVSDFFPWIISCHFYDFIKNFNVSLHLRLLCWNVTLRLERILVWRFIVSSNSFKRTNKIMCCGNGSWCGCIARRIWNNHGWYSDNWLWEVFSDATCIILWYIVYVGPWVLGWKSLKPSRKTLRCGCMGLVLPLGFSP